MSERRKTVAVCAVLLASLVAGCVARSQTVSAPQNATGLPPGLDILTLRFAPGKWWSDLQGDVRSVETTEFRLVSQRGRAIETRINSQTVYFDRKGFETEMADGEEGRTVLSYDARGLPTEMMMTLAGSPFVREVYGYDLSQRKVTATSYYFGRDKPRSREVSTFDERWGEIRKERETFADDPAAGSEPKSVVIYTHVYDAKGRNVSTTIGGEDGSISHKFTSEYNDRNRLVKSFSYEYDEKSGQLLSKSVNTYDERGYLLTMMRYDARGRLVRRETYTREYDQRGNWITQRHVTWNNDQPPGATGTFTYIKRRKITYY